MKKSGEYIDRAILTKFKVDGYETIIDFNGKVTDDETIQRRYKAYMTPTIMFLDSEGEELGEKRVGLTTPDFYGYYLDLSIDESLAMLREGQPVSMNDKSAGSN